MKISVIGFAGFLIVALSNGPAAAWSHANSYGGHASGGGGSWSASGARGGSASGGGGSWSGRTAYGGTASGEGGSWNAHGAEGGTASGGGGTWSATNQYGTTAYGKAGYGATTTSAYHTSSTNYYGAYYPAYHPPTAVNYYSSDCYNCRGWNTAGAAVAGAAVGMAVGAAEPLQTQMQSRRTPTTRLRRWQYRHCVCDGRDISAGPRRLCSTQRWRHNLLLMRQYVVPAIVRRERRLLSRGATPGLIEFSLMACRQTLGRLIRIVPGAANVSPLQRIRRALQLRGYSASTPTL